MLGWLTRRLRALLRKAELERELDEEVRFHLEREIERNVARGMRPDEARRAALVSFGGVEQIKEECRDVRGARVLEDRWQDLRYGARMLWKRPAFAFVVVLTLALGIGANTAIFSVFNGVVLKPLPYKDPDRLVYLRRGAERGLRYEQGSDARFGTASPGGFHDWRERSRSFESVSAHRGNTMILTGADRSERVWSRRVADRFFETLGVGAQLGRTFTDRDYGPDAPRVVVLADELWRSHYGADPQIVGRAITLDGLPHTVVGVMPPGFFPAVWAKPHVWVAHYFGAEEKADRSAGRWNVIARLRPGVSFEQAQAEMDLIAAQLEADDPEHYRNRGIVLVPAEADLVGSLGRVFTPLLWAVGLVLLIACVNVGNLLLVRAGEREREFAVRAALGAKSGRLFCQLLTESVLLAALGGALGLLLGLAGMRSVTALLTDASGVPRLEELEFDWRVFAFTAGVSLLTGLLFGLIPAMRASRPDLQEALKEGSRGNASSLGIRRVGNLLVIGEVALSMLLLVGGGLIVQSFIRLLRTDPGFVASRLLTMQVHVPDYKYGHYKLDVKEMESRVSLFHQIEERVNALPGVESAAVAGRLPVRDAPSPSPISIEGRAPAASEPEGCAELSRKAGLSCHGVVGLNRVTPAYFRTLGLRLVRGRAFDERDTAGATMVAVISETTARKYWPDEDPLGKRFTLNYTGWFPKLEIVGVVSDIQTGELDKPPFPEIYHPMAQSPADDGQLIIRTRADREALLNLVRDEVARIDRDVPLLHVNTMEGVIADTLWRARLSAWLLGLFAALAAALAAAGLYGVMSYSVSQRTRELGLRMALGAEPWGVLRMVIGEGFKLTAVGLALGLVASFALSRFIASQLFGVTATDPLTYAAVALLLATAALVACYVPARRAARVDPMVALRYE
ncbi:MAG: ABC transporter permease [Acidobacteriota bacterium]|nr:ABC transporter permease [Acidobacteriota bacterium]